MRYKKEAFGLLILAIITFALGYAWNQLAIDAIDYWAAERKYYLLWLFVYASGLTFVAIIIVVYLFPILDIHKKPLSN